MVAFLLWLPSSLSQDAAPAIIVQGTVHSATGEPVANASVFLQEKEKSAQISAKTNADGMFTLSVPRVGVYILTAQKSGWRDAVRDNLTLSSPKTEVNLILQKLNGPSSDSGGMELSDKPSFTVAGVTDSTQGGGHGSDAGLRTSEALARETIALKSGKTNEILDHFLSEGIGDRKPNGSESQLRAALVQSPGSYDANRRLGEFYFLSKKYQSALPLLEAANQINPEDHANAYDLALTYSANGDFAKAREQVRKMLARTDTAQLHLLLANLDDRLDNPLEAVHEYEQATRMDPSEQNYFEWGSELLLHRAVVPAAEVFTKGSNTHPNSVRMLAGLGAALYAGGFYDQAADRVCAASDLKPDDPEPYLFLGSMEDTAPAPLPCVEQKVERFVQIQPENAMANYYYAMVLLKRAPEPRDTVTLQKVEALFKRAVTLDPTLGQAHLQLGILYSDRGNYEQAIHVYQKAIEVSPQLGEAHYRLGVAYRHTGDQTKAQQEFQMHQQVKKTETAAIERQRREVQQFLIVLQNQPATTSPKTATDH